ncbi:MAG: hypothetical protein QF926_06405 [Alphaproteobacteria bacterium]|jgi:hypothetical protein|nr:hypothetical protein [Alphaproteobacteria bacterium]MDP6516234.1 hypothetical protein [Alphaproteobacteria bacterium]|tara:strand:- start:193 stop:474 length:282 start_codon:yes stop_codon:yes gene_type:complete
MTRRLACRIDKVYGDVVAAGRAGELRLFDRPARGDRALVTPYARLSGESGAAARNLHRLDQAMIPTEHAELIRFAILEGGLERVHRSGARVPG